ncbi:hypothetical protein AHAS_AhasUnG0049800 [Arachis hypogaea]
MKKILESNGYFTIEQMEGLIQSHLGVGIIDELYDRFTKKQKIVALFVLLRRKLHDQIGHVLLKLVSKTNHRKSELHL